MRVCALIVFAAGCLADDTWPSTELMSGDFEAEVSLSRSGLNYTGWMQVDTTGHRYAEFLDQPQQMTVVVQPAGRTFTYKYITVPTTPVPTCTCSRQTERTLGDYWWQYMNARRFNQETCTGYKTGKSGNLYTLDGTAYGSGSLQLCQAQDGTPLYISDSTGTTEFLTYKPGRISQFNMSEVQKALPGCASGC
eukprot:TRINITY_DN18496_c0_g1_i1.p2 TRINITY_DN18496_c0_g1~~TRINITY_DN18496_c0_g1_i1.p2  ORF type:complete len:193 (+),score=61.21 TRINITY_DN18496_c0_g1_i1:62-640(+)